MAQETAQKIDLIQASAPFKTIRLLLDARKLGHGGIGVYLERLIEGLRSTKLVKLNLIVSFDVAGDPFLRRKFGIEGLNLIKSNAKPYSFKEYFAFARSLKFENFDIFHAPHYTLPYSIPIPKVVTVHDIIHVSHPEKFYYPFIARRLITSALKRANLVFADSHSTAWQLRKLLKAKPHPSSKIKVVPVMLDPYFVSKDRSPFEKVEIKLPEQFFLTVCSQPKPHKGLEDLLAALQIFYKDQAHQKLTMVFVGSGAKQLDSLLQDRYADLVPYIRSLGIVSKADLRNCYRKATAVVVPSRAEGFGLPVLEARASGTPVLVRPVPALCELVDNQQSVVAKDFSIEALADSLSLLKQTFENIESSGLEDDLSIFGADNVVPQIIDAYRNVLLNRS